MTGGEADVRLAWATRLTPAEESELAALLDRQNAALHGRWADRPWYGYAPGELHALAVLDGRLVGHAGSGRRFVGVGSAEVVVAGVGAVLTDRAARGRGVGRALLHALQDAARGAAPADFLLLGCREEVAGFYAACGFRRCDQPVRDLSPEDGRTVVVSRGPTMIAAGRRPVEEWPGGEIDLRGLPW